MFGGLMVRPVTVKRPLYGDTDRYGNDSPVWSDDTSWYDTSCWIHDVSSEEQQDDMERRVIGYTLYFQPDAELEATYRIEIDGRDFEVVGDPQLFHTPRGPHHYEVSVRVVEG